MVCHVICHLRIIFAIGTTALSYYLTDQTPNLFKVWISFTILATLLSIFIDTKYDWGFLSKSNLLREKLAYPNLAFYYISIFLNIFLRLAWSITLSSFASSSPLVQNLVILLTSLMELVRRFLWNYFRVEFGHLMGEGNFDAV